jgi:hypothetical protein
MCGGSIHDLKSTYFFQLSLDSQEKQRNCNMKILSGWKFIFKKKCNTILSKNPCIYKDSDPTNQMMHVGIFSKDEKPTTFYIITLNQTSPNIYNLKHT